jgi:eukaryotic-like serine/threonine-protein kinase
VVEPDASGAGVDASAEASTQDGRRPRERAGAPSLPERYVQLEKLGEGGMGIVHAALDRTLGRRVAIKWVRGDAHGEAAQRRRARLVREARAIAALSHPNVIAVFDVGEIADDVWVAMELVEGVDLRRWLAAERREWRAVLDVFVQAGEGLAAAHSSGLVHRDFKPANVMIGREPRGGPGRVRVLDFGLARAATTGCRSPEPDPPGSDPAPTALLTGAGQRIGTPAYMSPEQHAGEDADASSDQFAFCVALHEALYGVRPFEGDRAPSIAAAVLLDRRRALPRGRAVPGWLRRTLRRGTARQPAHRFPSMRALLDHIARCRRRRIELVALAGLAAIGIAVWAGSPSAAPGCPELELGAIWNDARRAELAERFAASDAPFAQASFDAVARGLDRHVERLTAAAGPACLPARDEAAIACLRGPVAAVSAFVDELVRADADTIEIATVALAELPEPGVCTDAGRRHARAPSPGDRTLAAQVAGLRTRMAEVRSLADLARYQRALAAARTIADEAKPLGFAPVYAEALALLGDTLAYVGEREQAEASFREALWLAESEGHDAVMVDATVELAWMRYEDGAPDDEIDRLLAAGDAAATRAGDLDHYLPVLINIDASRLLARGRFDQARARWQQALAWMLVHGSISDPDVPNLLHNLGNAHILGGAPELAAWSYAQALELTLRNLGPDHPSTHAERQALADALTQLGRAEEALPIYATVLAYRERAFAPDDPRLASTHANLGAALRTAGRYPEAVTELERAIALKRELGLPSISIARTLTELARTHDDAGATKMALATVEQALGLLDAALDVPPHELAGPLELLVGILERERVVAAEDPARMASGERLADRLGDHALRERFTELREQAAAR